MSLLRAPAVGLVLASCLSTLPVPALAATGDVPAEDGAGLGSYYRQRLGWGGCAKGPEDATGRALDRAGAQCADVTVPLDYNDPRGRRITVAVSRLRATDTRRRIGSLLLNNGGPGGPAVQSPPDRGGRAPR